MNLFPKSLSLKLLCVTAVLALLGGCRTVPLDDAGEFQAVNQAGKFRMLVNADSARTLQATREVLSEMRLTEVSSEVARFQASLLAETELGEPVRVNIFEVNSRQSEIQIRVKWVGHQEYSRRMWEKIDARVSATP